MVERQLFSTLLTSLHLEIIHHPYKASFTLKRFQLIQGSFDATTNGHVDIFSPTELRIQLTETKNTKNEYHGGHS